MLSSYLFVLVMDDIVRHVMLKSHNVCYQQTILIFIDKTTERVMLS